MTKPADCALALAIPLSREAWSRDLADGSGREYAKWYAASRGGVRASAEDIWVKLYEPNEVRPIVAILDELTQLGAAVVTECRLTDLVGLARRKQVVVVVAHWRSGLVYPDQVLDRYGFVERLRTATSGILAALRRRLPADLRVEIETGRLVVHGARFERLLQALNESLGDGSLAGPRPADEAPSPIPFYVETNRAKLDRACDGTLDTTAGLELADGTYPGARVAQALPPDFRGVFDLTVCFSVVLAECIKRAVPRCLILANREPTAPAIRLPIVRETIKLLHRRPGSYIQTAMAIRERLQGRRSTA